MRLATIWTDTSRLAFTPRRPHGTAHSASHASYGPKLFSQPQHRAKASVLCLDELLDATGSALAESLQANNSGWLMTEVAACSRVTFAGFGLKPGALVVLLQRYAFEEQGIAFQVDVDCRQFPNRWADLLLFQSKRAALLQSSQQASAEGDVVHEVTLYFADAVLLVIDHQIAGHAAEYTCLARRRVETWRGFKVQ